MRARFAAWLESPRLPLACALLAALLSAPSLGAGLQTDDHLTVYRLERGMPLFGSFRITPEGFAAAQQVGTFPWWQGPDLRIAFLRPLAELSSRLDAAMWGDDALPMHATNILIYALIAWLAARIFRQLLPVRTAGMAALLFVINDAHAGSVGWISGRNTLLALLFGLASILAYLRSEGRPAARLASPLLLALSLASAEAGVATLAYFMAHALVLADGTPRARARALLPHALVTLAWATLYVAGDYGAHGAAWYRDLGGAPLATLAAGLADLPTWLFSQLGISFVAVLLALPEQARLVPALLLLPIVAALVPTVRATREGRFFALGMLLSIVPLFNTVPQDRVMLVPSLGGFGLLACALVSTADARSRLLRVSLRTLAVLHLVLSPLFFLRSVTSQAVLEGSSRRLAAALPEPGGDVILVQSPLEILPMYAMTIRQRATASTPRSLHQLYAGGAELSVTRPDARTLEVRATPGWCSRGIECIFRAPDASARERGARRFGPFVRTVIETGAHPAARWPGAPVERPVAVRFTFDEPLESARYTWLSWQGIAPAPWELPAVGGTRTLPALQPLRALSR